MPLSSSVLFWLSNPSLADFKSMLTDKCEINKLVTNATVCVILACNPRINLFVEMNPVPDQRLFANLVLKHYLLPSASKGCHHAIAAIVSLSPKAHFYHHFFRSTLLPKPTLQAV